MKELPAVSSLCHKNRIDLRVIDHRTGEIGPQQFERVAYLNCSVSARYCGIATLRSRVIMSKASERVLKDLSVLVVDCNPYMRRVTRTMLITLGVRSVFEAPDGIAALDMIRHHDPDVMLLDWDTPVLNGMELMRMVRCPGVFPCAKLPTVMLTYQAKRVHVLEAMRLGVHEFLVKPTSAKALGDRLISIVTKPRPMIAVGDYYVPKPRRASLPATAQKRRIGL